MLFVSILGYSQIDNRNFEDLIESKILVSNINGNRYNIQVSLPKTYYDNDSKSYPVLYALDGMHSVPMLNSIRQYMEIGNYLEEFIIVGIQGNIPRNRLMQHRIPDYTPLRDTVYENRFSQIMGLKKGSVLSGKADEFLKVISDQVIPYIDKNYRVDNRSGLLGHSLAGLFTAYTLINKPELFNFYLISSPSLNWDDGNFVKRLKPDEINKSDISVFISVGGEEKELHNFIELFQKKLEHSNFDTVYKVYDKESHFSVVAGSFSNGILQFAGKK